MGYGDLRIIEASKNIQNDVGMHAYQHVNVTMCHLERHFDKEIDN